MVQIGQNSTRALIDTGSQLTLASESFFKSTKIRGTQEKPDFLFIRDVGGSRIPIRGKINVPIEIQGNTLMTSVHIVRNLQYNVILGLDFMEKHNVKIDVGSQLLLISESNATIPVMRDQAFARTVGKTVVPPMHETLVPVRISKYETNETVLLEPVEHLQSRELQKLWSKQKIRDQFYECVIPPITDDYRK